MNILVINPGSTSTKIALFKDEGMILEETIRHTASELLAHGSIPAQKDFRFKAMAVALSKHGYAFEEMDAVAARGGIIKPIESGTYEINEAMVDDLKSSRAALHASCLAGLIGYDLKMKYSIPAFVVDPVVVDELSDVARLTGTPDVKRASIFHALNQKAVARQASLEIGKPYEALNLIVAHLGGGISVAAHEKGRAVDVNNAICGEGPFSPERIGTIAPLQIAELIFQKGYSYQDIKDLTSKKGGLIAYFGTNDLRAIEAKISEGDTFAKEVFDAMAYQVAKQIGAMAAALSGEVQGIVLTGGLAYSKDFCEAISSRVKFLAPLFIYPGEFELFALASSVREVMLKNVLPKTYN
ncbi:MAG: butyrate kinase [Turicibacter sp.]|nr:butyrate kinase [Turicibacter sp.]